MSGVSNCPNCGAILTGNKCDFCGTEIYDFTSIGDEHPAFIKLRYGGKTIIFRALLEYASIRFEDYPVHCDNAPLMKTTSGSVCLGLNMVCGKDGNLFKIVE